MKLCNIHTHALWGLDDGAKSIEETLDMLGAMYASGVDTVCLTPHFDPVGGFDTDIGDVSSRFSELRTAVGQKLPDLHLSLGEEVFFHVDIVKNLTSGVCLSLNGSRSVLLEFGPRESLSEIVSGVEKLLTSGFIPIIAHTERYLALVKNRRELLRLKDAGAMVQLNASSVCGKNGFAVRRVTDRLIRMGIADAVADDSHNMTDRAPDLADAERYVRRKFGDAACARLFCDGPREILGL